MTDYRAAAILVSLCCFHLLGACAANPVFNSDLYESIQWYTGASGQVNDSRARSLLEEAIASGDTLAVMWEARVYSTGRMGFPQDLQRARGIAEEVISEVERLANAGSPEAMFLIGTAFAEGLGKDIDAETAACWYEQAALKGHMLAQHNLGNIYASGTGVVKDEAQAIFWWRKAAVSGDAIPQYRLGVMYETGNGTNRDLEEAMRWYREAASRGNTAARDALQRITAE